MPALLAMLGTLAQLGYSKMKTIRSSMSPRLEIPQNPCGQITPCLQGAEEGAAPLLRHGHPGHQEAEAGQRLRHLRQGIQRQLGAVTGDITMDTFKCIYRMSKYGLLYIVLVLSKNKYWE